MVSVDNNGNSKEFFDSGKLKGGVKKREVDKKFHQLFDMLDSDGNKILDSNEVNNLTSIINVQDKDSATKEYVADFAQSLSEASENIIDSKTTVNSDGTKTIVTLFNNNTMETVTYYPDGEIKMKRVDKKVTQKTYTIGNTTYTEAEFNKLLNNPELSNALATAIPGENTSIATKIEFSERGKQELKEFTGTHFKDTVDEQYNMMKKFDYTAGDLDKVGVFLSDSAQELYSELSGGEYNTYAELWHIVNENKKNADSLAFTTKIDPNSPWAKTHPDVQTDFEKVYQDTTGQKYDILKADEFQRTAVKYQTVTALKQRTEYLNESIKKIDKLYHEEQLRKQGITVPDREETFDEVLMDTLTNYFGSEEIAATFLGGVSEGIESIKDVTPDKMNEMLKEIKRMTEERYQSVLGDEKYENLHSRYLKEYKEFYGVENLKDDIESSISTGQMTGEMLKMGVVITTSIMLGGSTLLQQGGKALAAKLGPKAAKEAIRLGMSFGSIGESYGIDLLNAMSSKEGLTEEKKDLLIQKQISSLPYVLFGAYVSGPIGDSVKNFLKSNPSASSNMLNTLFAKTSSSAGFTSEVTADALLELTLQGGNLSAVFGSNAQGEAFGRFMNMLIGGRANKGAFNALQDVKIQQNKLPDGSIEYTTINKDGVEFKTKNPDEIVLGLLGVAAQKSTEGRNIKTMPDGTVIEVNKDGSTTVLQEGVNNKVETQGVNEGTEVLRTTTETPTGVNDKAEIPRTTIDAPETEARRNGGDGAVQPRIQQIDAGEPEFKHFTREEIEMLKQQDKNVKEMSNGDVFRIGDDGTFTKIGTTKAPIKDSSVDLSNVDADKVKVMINDFIKNNKLDDIKDPVIQNKISQLQNEILDSKTKKHAMAVLNVFKAFKENNIDTNFSQNAVDFITVDNYTKVIDYMKSNKNNFNSDECVAKITKDVVTSNKTTKQLYNRAAALADTPEMQNKFAAVIYNTINTTTGDKLISQIELMSKMNDDALKTYINSMPETLARVDEAIIKTLNNIDLKILNKYVRKYLSMMDKIKTDKFATLIKGFENMPGGIAAHINSNIEQPIIDSILLNNKGIIDVFQKTNPETFDRIPDDVKVELSNKLHVYTDGNHISSALDFIETPKFKEVENVIKSKFPHVYNESFEAKLKAYYIANNTGNPDDFIKYVKNIDADELFKMAPRVAKFEEEQLIEFLNYHHQKGTEFTVENLTYSGSLTKDMQKDLMDYDKLSQLLSRFPNTDRRIGHLPQEWMNNIPKENQKKFANELYEKINTFVTSARDNLSVQQFESSLTQLFNQKVTITQLTTGNYGTGYQITVGSQKSFVLKAFNTSPKDFKGYNVHGRTIEPQNAMYAKGRSNDFAGFYFGSVADKFDNDGFMLVEFLPKKDGPEKPKDLSIHTLTSADFDAKQKHNFQNGKIIDYGAMMPVDKKMLEDKGIAKYTRIISSNIIALKGSETYGFNESRLKIVKNAVQKAENPMQVVEAINIIERNAVQNIDINTLRELKQIKKDAFIKYIKETKPDANPEALFIEYELNNK